MELIHFLDITEETENNVDKEQYFLKVLETVHKKSKDFKIWDFIDTFSDQKLGCIIWDDIQADMYDDNFEFRIENYTFYYDKEINPLICSDLAIFLGLALLYQYLNISKINMDVFNKPDGFADFLNGLQLEEDGRRNVNGALNKYYFWHLLL